MSNKALLVGIMFGASVASLAFVVSEKSPALKNADNTYYDKPVFQYDYALAAYCDEDTDGDLGPDNEAIDMDGKVRVFETCDEARNLGIIPRQ